VLAKAGQLLASSMRTTYVAANVLSGNCFTNCTRTCCSNCHSPGEPATLSSLFLLCPFNSSSVALFYFFSFSCSDSLYLFFRLHRSTTYVDAAYSYQLSSVVCRSVCHTSEPCKIGCTARAAVWVEDLGGPGEPCIRWGLHPPMGRGKFLGEIGRPIVKYRDSTVVCAKTAEPIGMPFGLWARMGRRNHVLDGVHRC